MDLHLEQPRAIASLHLEQMTCAVVQNLFGNGSNSTPIFATRDTLDKLAFGIGQHGIFVQPELLTSPTRLPTSSYQHFQRRNEFPNEENLQHIYEMSPVLSVALNLDELVSKIPGPVPSVGIPEFQMINLFDTLVFLATAAAYHEKWTLHHQNILQTRIYELGILTQMIEQSRPSFMAQIWKTRGDVQSTNTIWLFRKCEIMAGLIVEDWYSIGTTTEPLIRFQSAQAGLLGVLSPIRDPLGGIFDNSEVPENTPGQPLQHHGATSPHEGIDLSSKTAEEILAGDPDDVVQDAILRVAASYSNVEIFDKLNENFRGLERPEMMNVKAIAGRITVALASAARRLDRPKEELREELNAVRRTNGVHDRMLVRNRAARRLKRKEQRRALQNRVYTPDEPDFDDFA